jgi:Reverse transcriptase (RNA-dependent DNA polymerase)
MIIVKALYGLKSSGKRWHERLFDVLLSLGFTPTKAEEDIWIKDMGDHYDYIAVYVDDMMIALKDPKWIIKGLKAVPFSLKGTGPVTYHLGCDYFHGILCVGPRKYIEKMVGEYERLFGKKPSLKVRSPLEHNDHPELDISPILDEDGIRKY